MRLETPGAERRRRWCDQKKLEIVTSVGVDGATVTDVAQQHDVTRQQIYMWRREPKKKGLLLLSPGAVFLPVDMNCEQTTSGFSDGVAASSAMIELQLRCGRNLRFASTMDGLVLTRLIRAVEQA